MDDFATIGNLVEAGLWLVVSLVLTVQAIRSAGKPRAILAGAFVVLAFPI